MYLVKLKDLNTFLSCLLPVYILLVFVCVLVCTCAFLSDFNDSKGSILLYLNHFKDIKKNYCCGVSSLKLDRTN